MSDSSTKKSRRDPDAIKMYVGQIPLSYNAIDCEKFLEVYGRINAISIPLDAKGQRKGHCFVTFFHRKDAISALDALHNVRKLPGMEKPIQMRPVGEEENEEEVAAAATAITNHLSRRGPLLGLLLMQNPRVQTAAETLQQHVLEAVLYDVLTGGGGRLATGDQTVNNAANSASITSQLQSNLLRLRQQQTTLTQNMPVSAVAVEYAAAPSDAKPFVFGISKCGPGGCISVSPIPDFILDDDIRSEFAPLGNILKVRVPFKVGTATRGDIGYVLHDNSLTAAYAVAVKNGSMFGGKKIKVQVLQADALPFCSS